MRHVGNGDMEGKITPCSLSPPVPSSLFSALTLLLPLTALFPDVPYLTFRKVMGSYL